jgi:hypothetical protein
MLKFDFRREVELLFKAGGYFENSKYEWQQAHHAKSINKWAVECVKRHRPDLSTFFSFWHVNNSANCYPPQLDGGAVNASLTNLKSSDFHHYAASRAVVSRYK